MRNSRGTTPFVSCPLQTSPLPVPLARHGRWGHDEILMSEPTTAGGDAPLLSRRVPPEVALRIGPYYVYILIDPRDDQIFYVGKGTGDRPSSHDREAARLTLEAERSRAKTERIRDITAAGLKPLVDIVRHGFETEDEAFQIEAALIDCLRPNITNIDAGHGTDAGRMPLEDLIARYGASDLSTEVPEVALLIRLQAKWNLLHEEVEPGYFRKGSGWKPRLTDQELYDSVRAWWAVSPTSADRHRAKHAVAVFAGVTRAVYRIENWLGPRTDGRWAFAGERVTAGPVFDAYCGPLGRRVPFAQGSRNPTSYWPPKADVRLAT